MSRATIARTRPTTPVNVQRCICRAHVANVCRRDTPALPLSVTEYCARAVAFTELTIQLAWVPLKNTRRHGRAPTIEITRIYARGAFRAIVPNSRVRFQTRISRYATTRRYINNALARNECPSLFFFRRGFAGSDGSRAASGLFRGSGVCRRSIRFFNVNRRSQTYVKLVNR